MTWGPASDPAFTSHAVTRLLRDLRSPPLQRSLSHAAGFVAKWVRRGRTVHLSGEGHLVNYEMLRGDSRIPFRVCRRDQIDAAAQPGDLLVWIGYMGCVGLRPRGDDLLACLLDRGVDVIFCEAPLPGEADTAPQVLAQVAWDVLLPVAEPSPVIATIDQSWAMPDAKVPVPWPPGRMAPVSGLNALLLFRMLDEQDAALLPVGKPVP